MYKKYYKKAIILIEYNDIQEYNANNQFVMS